jgi:hypothetical protein
VVVKNIRIIIWSILILSPLNAEETYQRYDIVRENDMLTVEGSMGYNAETVNKEDFYTFTPAISLEYDFALKHSINFILPSTIAFYENYEARNKIFYATGDINLSYEYFKQIKDNNLFFRPQITIPLTTTNEYKEREGIISAGAGRYTAGCAFSTTGIRDPVVWSAGFQYIIGLPKKERFNTIWQPGNMQVSGAISNLFNERFGGLISLYQNINLPEISDDVPDKSGLNVSTRLVFETLTVFEKDYVKIGIETYLYPLSKPVTIRLTYGHQFKITPKKDAKVSLTN